MPTPTKVRALELLDSAIDPIQTFRGKSVSWPDFVKWRRSTKVTIEKIFGTETKHVEEFFGIRYSAPHLYVGVTTQRDDDSPFFEAGLQRAKAVLESMVEEIETHWSDEPEQEKNDFWSLLHPEIIGLCKSRFDSGYYADCIETGLKFINSAVKKKVKAKTGNELDGAGLMTTAFSVNNPVICLGDLSTDTGKSAQQGYMQIFAGTMTGIRNPKAHEVIDLDENKAIHFLFLASLLMIKLDEAL